VRAASANVAIAKAIATATDNASDGSELVAA